QAKDELPGKSNSSLRPASSSAAAMSIPAAASSGVAWSRIRPFGRAKVKVCRSGTGAMIPRHPGAERVEPLFDPLVATVDVVDPADLGGAFGHQAGEHQRGAGPKVGGHDGGPREARGPAHHRGVAVDHDVGAEPVELGHVHEPVLEDRL